MRSLALAAAAAAVGFGVGWLVFATHGAPSRHDVEQAVVESGHGTPLSATCGRQPGTDRIWRCTAKFPQGQTQTYQVVARSRSDMDITPVE